MALKGPNLLLEMFVADEMLLNSAFNQQSLLDTWAIHVAVLIPGGWYTVCPCG